MEDCGINLDAKDRKELENISKFLNDNFNEDQKKWFLKIMAQTHPTEEKKFTIEGLKRHKKI